MPGQNDHRRQCNFIVPLPSLRIAGGDVDYIEARYSDTLEVQSLEKVFPRMYWSAFNSDAIENPPEFDFLRNAGLAGRVITDFASRMKGNAGDPCWAREFMKTYHAGEALQKLGLRPRVSIG